HVAPRRRAGAPPGAGRHRGAPRRTPTDAPSTAAGRRPPPTTRAARPRTAAPTRAHPSPVPRAGTGAVRRGPRRRAGRVGTPSRSPQTQQRGVPGDAAVSFEAEQRHVELDGADTVDVVTHRGAHLLDAPCATGERGEHRGSDVVCSFRATRHL